MKIRAQSLRHIIKFSRLTFTPLALLFLGYILYDNHAEIRDLLENAAKKALVIPVVLVALIHLLVPTVTSAVNNHPITWQQLLYIHTMRIPSRYLPGGIWQTVAKAADYKSHGMGNTAIGKLTALEIVISILSAVALGLAALSPTHGLSLTVASAAIIALVLILNRLLGVTRSKLTLAIGLYLVIWILIGGAFSTYLASFSEVDLSKPEAIGAYLLSWVIGYFAFFAPQGIGITEYSFCIITNNPNPEVWIMVLFGFRIITMLADVSAYLLASIFFRKPNTVEN